MTDRLLKEKRVLVTHADVFMGPALCEVVRSARRQSGQRHKSAD